MKHPIPFHLLRRGAVTFLAAVLGLGSLSLGAGAERERAFGDVTTLASLPDAPGFPEGIAVDGDRVFVSGSAPFVTAGKGPSAIQVFERKSGDRLQTIFVKGEDLAVDHGLGNLAIDKEGRVYALSSQLGLLRFTRNKNGKGYAQSVYGEPLPNLPPRSTVPAGTPSSPTSVDLPPFPNDIVFDDDGYAYVTDSYQATIFRYAPGGGKPKIWFQSFLFEGGGGLPFGVNGIRLNPEGSHFYVVLSTSIALPGYGGIYRIPHVKKPTEKDLQFVHGFINNEFPDQIAFGENGRMYVTLAQSNQICVHEPGGVDARRISNTPQHSLPFSFPGGMAFDSGSKSLLVANQARNSAIPADFFAVLKVFVDDKGDPLEKPLIKKK